MTLLEHTKDLFKKGVELYLDEVETVSSTGVKLTRNTKLLRTDSLAAISTDSAKEWYTVVRLNCPVGTIIEPYEFEEDEWTTLYNDVVALCRVEITKKLIDERFVKSASILMKVLEKRDNKHWSDNKTVDVKTNGSEPISIHILGV